MAQVNFVCRCQFGCSDSADEPQYEFVRIMDPREDISLMIGAFDPVVSDSEIQIIYDYPLKEPISFSHRNEKGFTRADLARCVSDDYHRIYRDHPEKIAGSDYTSQLNYLVLAGLKPHEDQFGKNVRTYQALVIS